MTPTEESKLYLPGADHRLTGARNEISSMAECAAALGYAYPKRRGPLKKLRAPTEPQAEAPVTALDNPAPPIGVPSKLRHL